jgi:AcrR family transcriptional regulator
VALVDVEGLAALTMRRLAASLDVEAMSLYHHVPGKQALLDGVVEAVVTEILDAAGSASSHPTSAGSHPTATGATPATPASPHWRTAIRSQFLAARQIMMRHPWMPSLLATSRTIPPAVYGYYDSIVGTLVAAGFSYHLAHRAMHAFGSLPLGFAQEMFSPASAGGSMDESASEAEFAAMAEALPHLTAMVTAEVHDAEDPTLGWCDSQIEFEFTLDLLLDGFERLRRTRSEPS